MWAGWLPANQIGDDLGELSQPIGEHYQNLPQTSQSGQLEGIQTSRRADAQPDFSMLANALFRRDGDHDRRRAGVCLGRSKEGFDQASAPPLTNCLSDRANSTICFRITTIVCITIR